jgi:hypothetical protein
MRGATLAFIHGDIQNSIEIVKKIIRNALP